MKANVVLFEPDLLEDEALHDCYLPIYDNFFLILANKLSTCSTKRGTCFDCRHIADCGKLFDRLSEQSADKPLPMSAYIVYFQKFEKFITS